MKEEIGGYIELENFSGNMLHEDALALNCGRNALAYLIEARNIEKIRLPYFMCDSVSGLCKKYEVAIQYYHINEHFFPEEMKLSEGEWLYLADYYGQLQKEDIRKMGRKYGRVIVDYAQAYFEMPPDNIDSIYTCRKFFGVPDGAFLYTTAKLGRELEQDESYGRMTFLLGRYERTASEFYEGYVENNRRFVDEPLRRMSGLTKNLLHGINYESVKKARTINFSILAEKLGFVNQLELGETEGAFAYPLLVENGRKIRENLVAHRVYIPVLWPNVLKNMPIGTLEYKMAENILPLPCDQRYGTEEMEYICKLILESIK